MPNLEAQAAWPPVREIGIELARGGPNGNMNEQAKALLARTEYLNQQKASKSEIVQGVFEFSTYAEFNAAKETLPLNCTVVINQENTTGSGQWGIGNNIWNGSILKKSENDPLVKAQKYVDLKLVEFPSRSGYIAGIVTSENKILIAFKREDGSPVFANGKNIFESIQNDKVETLQQINIVHNELKQRVDDTDEYIDEMLEQSKISRSRILCSVTTPNGQIPFYLDALNGHIVSCGIDINETLKNHENRILSVNESLSVEQLARSGVLFGILSKNKQMPFYIDMKTGRPILAGIDVLNELDQLKNNTNVQDVELQLLPDDALAGWGDSLTAPGSSGDWLQKLANNIGWSYYNGGIGGQGSKQIASRCGAVPTRITQAFTIPSTTTPTQVLVNDWTPCSKAGSAQLVNIKGITGQLSRSADDIHTFTRLEAGEEVSVGVGSYAYSVTGSLYSKRLLIIGTGRNSQMMMRPHEIVSTVRAMINHQKTQIKRCIVWSVPYFPGDDINTKARIDAINNALAQAFPEYWVDLNAWLCSSSPVTFGYTTINDPFTVLGVSASSQDLVDIQNKLTPISFRTSETDGHFNQLCGTAIAYRFQKELEIKGWK